MDAFDVLVDDIDGGESNEIGPENFITLREYFKYSAELSSRKVSNNG